MILSLPAVISVPTCVLRWPHHRADKHHGPPGSDVPPTRARTAPISGENREKAGGFFGRLKAALGRTRGALVSRLTRLFSGRDTLDEQLIEDLETVLLSADVGIEATAPIL